jgi:hypothetical protein
MMSKGKCAECGADLHGRSDKKFCDDQCRSTFNNKTYAQDLRSVREVNRILLSNRRILKDLSEECGAVVTWSLLMSKGFDPNYFTGVKKSINTELIVQCYEYSWQRKGTSVKIERNKKGELK